MSEKLFDIFNLDDLPDEMKREVENKRMDEFERKILELFELAKRPLLIDEVMVGLYRGYGIQKNHRQVMNKLYQMSQGNTAKIETSKKGVYQLKQKENYNAIITDAST